MTDQYSDGQLGEDILGNALTEVVQYDATITAGQLCKITGVNSDGQAKLDVAGAGDKARFVAMVDGVQGDVKEALKRGVTKVTYGGAVTLPAAIKAGATGKAVAAVSTVTIPAGATAVTSSSAQPAMTVEAGIACGFSYHTVTTDGDTGLVFFNGEAP